MEEEWRDIKDYEGLYQVSNLGRVKSLNYKHTGREKILKSLVDKDGYQRVILCKNGYIKNYFVHRLEYEAFYGEIPKGMQVNHINEIKTDNRVVNLNLMTPKENSNWGTRTKRVAEKRKGKKHTEEAKNKISEANSKSVLQIDIKTNEIIKEFSSTREVQRQLGYNHGNISNCCNGKYKTCGGFKWQYK